MVNAIEVSVSFPILGDVRDTYADFSVQRNLKRQLAEPVEVTLSRPRPDMWDNLMIMFKTTLEKAEENYMAKARSESDTEKGSKPTH